MHKKGFSLEGEVTKMHLLSL